MASTLQSLILLLFLYEMVDCGFVRYKPVHERANEDTLSILGNPMSGLSHSEIRQRAKIHVQNQQLRYNAEKSRKQKAMSERNRDSHTMDSYMKAYREQHDGFQSEIERKQQRNRTKVQDIPIFPKLSPIRNKRVNSPRDLVSLKDYESDAVYNKLAEYKFSPSYLLTPSHQGFNPIPDPELPKYMAEHQKKVYPTSQTTVNLQPYSYNNDVESLTALIGKKPDDQLRGFKQLIQNQKIASLDLNSAKSVIQPKIKKYDYVPPESQNAFIDSVHFFVPEKDHTPITENVQDVVDSRKPIPFYAYPTEDPSVQTSTSYYKVEVASKIVNEPSPGLQYINSYEKDQNNVSRKRGKRDVNMKVSNFSMPMIESNIKFETDIFITSKDLGKVESNDTEPEYYYYDEMDNETNTDFYDDDYDSFNDTSTEVTAETKLDASNSTDLPHFEAFSRRRKRRPLYRIYRGTKTRVHHPKPWRFKKYLIKKPIKPFHRPNNYHVRKRPVYDEPYDYEDQPEYQEEETNQEYEYEDDQFGDDFEDEDLSYEGSYVHKKYQPQYNSYGDYPEPDVYTKYSRHHPKYRYGYRNRPRPHHHHQRYHPFIRNDRYPSGEDYSDSDDGRFNLDIYRDLFKDVGKNIKNRFRNVDDDHHHRGDINLSNFDRKRPEKNTQISHHLINNDDKEGDHIHIGKLNVYHEKYVEDGDHVDWKRPTSHKPKPKPKPVKKRRRPHFRKRIAPRNKKKQIQHIEHNIDKLNAKLQKNYERQL